MDRDIEEGVLYDLEMIVYRLRGTVNTIIASGNGITPAVCTQVELLDNEMMRLDEYCMTH